MNKTAQPPVTLVTERRNITAGDMLTLFAQAEWTKHRTAEQVSSMLQRTEVIVVAKCEGRPIGCARVVTDGVFRAFVEDVIVMPTHRRLGIGRLMVNHLEQVVSAMGIRRLDLTTTQTGFWERLGYRQKTGSCYMVKIVPGS